MKHRLGSLALSLALTLLMVAGAVKAAAAASFQLVNNGDTTIYSVYVSRHSEEAWHDDVLGTNVLQPGQSTTVTFLPGAFDTCYWDVAVVYSDNHKEFFWNADFCDYDEITSTY